jgi:hypothetical protein
MKRAEREAEAVLRDRRRKVHGWVFRGLHPDEEKKIRTYVETGDEKILESVDWAHLDPAR